MLSPPASSRHPQTRYVISTNDYSFQSWPSPPISTASSTSSRLHSYHQPRRLRGLTCRQWEVSSGGGFTLVMLSYPVWTWSPSRATGVTICAPSVRPPRSSRTRALLLKPPAPTTDRDRTVSRRSEPSLRNSLMGRTAQPLEPTSAPGCDEPTRGVKPPRR